MSAAVLVILPSHSMRPDGPLHRPVGSISPVSPSGARPDALAAGNGTLDRRRPKRCRLGGPVAAEIVNDPACGICAVSTGQREVPHGILYQDDLWIVRHSAPPYGVVGWLTLQTRRHCPEPASFNDAEACGFGPTLRYFEGVLREITGALRIYTVAMGESFPHFHGHMVPRYAQTPGDVKTYGVFLLSERAAKGEVQVDEAEVARICEAFKTRVAGGVPSLP
jgi:histidine triad (HIT) family protein